MNKKFDSKYRQKYDELIHKKARYRKKRFKYYLNFTKNGGFLKLASAFIPLFAGAYVLKKFKEKMTQKLDKDF